MTKQSATVGLNLGLHGLAFDADELCVLAAVHAEGYPAAARGK